MQLRSLTKVVLKRFEGQGRGSVNTTRINTHGASDYIFKKIVISGRTVGPLLISDQVFDHKTQGSVVIWWSAPGQKDGGAS